MNQNGDKRPYFEFADFRLYRRERLLRRGEERIPLTPRVFDLLTVLVENRGELVTKEVLLDKVWAGRIVEEGNINRTVSTLRKKLGLQPNGGDFIETVPTVGYRFIVPVEEFSDAAAEEPPEFVKPRPYGLWMGLMAALLVGAAGLSIYFWRQNKAAESGGFTNLTNNLAEDNNPAFSPDGKKIAFTSNREGIDHIYVMNSDGSGVMRLTNADGADSSPTWSPDGSHILFDAQRDGNREVYSMNADGSGQKRLTFNPAVDGGPARFSPDGSKIVFARSAAVAGTDYYNFDIYLMNVDGSEQKQLTTSPEYDAEPIWSPDGSKILFVSGRDGSFDVFVMNADGSGQTNVTNTRGDNETPIGWVPDGSRMIYSRLSEKVAELYQIWVSNADGSDPRQVTTFTEKTTRQTYSAATGKFCFASKKNGNSEIYISEAPNLSGN